MTNGRQISVIHRFIGLGLDGKANFSIVRQHFVDRLYKEFYAATAILRFAQISSFTSEPENENVRFQIVGDVDGAQRALNRVFPAFRIVAGICAVDRHWAEPKSEERRV